MDIHKLEALGITVRTFLHDLDEAKGPVLMSSMMWMQVKAFRELLAEDDR